MKYTYNPNLFIKKYKIHKRNTTGTGEALRRSPW